MGLAQPTGGSVETLPFGYGLVKGGWLRDSERAHPAPMQTAHVLALTSALLSAGATILIRQGLRGSDPYAALWVNLVVGTAGLWAAVVLTGDFGHLSGSGVAFFALAGLIGTVAGRLLRFVAIEKVGASIAAALTNLNPLFAAILAIALLGERVTLPILAGTLIIVAGTTLLSLSRQRIGFRRWQLLIPVLSAACFGVVAVLRKLGLGHMGPVIGTAINVTTALVAYTAFLVASRHRGALGCRGRSLGYFLVAGLAENAAVFIHIVALRTGMVTVVTPLYGTSPIFVLVLSYVFLRGIETLTLRIVAGTLLIVLGVYLITAL
jgi:DME family drug/metabolite transporter